MGNTQVSTPAPPKELLSFLVCSQLSDVVLSEWKRKEKTYNFLSLSLFSSLRFWFFFFFVKAFGDIARKASILNLDARQDLHWVNFPGYTPLLAYQVLFITSDRKSCLLRASYVPADTYFFWASGSV